jgi:hypothetical protein
VHHAGRKYFLGTIVALQSNAQIYSEVVQTEKFTSYGTPNVIQSPVVRIQRVVAQEVMDRAPVAAFWELWQRPIWIPPAGEFLEKRCLSRQTTFYTQPTLIEDTSIREDQLNHVSQIMNSTDQRFYTRKLSTCIGCD